MKPKFGQFYIGGGTPVSDTEARRLLREGVTIECPQVGHGLSWRQVAARLGFKRPTVEDWTSSAGDWVFRVRGKRLLFQHNRYPLVGYSYSLCDEIACGGY